MSDLTPAVGSVADDKMAVCSSSHTIAMLKPARILTFKCVKCSKAVKVFLQKVSACSHIQPYQGICDCGEVRRHATGNKAAVESFLASSDEGWMHHH